MLGLLESGSDLLEAGSGLPRAGSDLLRAGSGLLKAGSGLLRAGSGLLRAGLGLGRDFRTYGWNFPLVFYRTSSPIGSADQKQKNKKHKNKRQKNIKTRTKWRKLISRRIQGQERNTKARTRVAKRKKNDSEQYCGLRYEIDAFDS